MAIHAALTHRTTYLYDRPTKLGPQLVRLRPAPHCRTPILSYSMTVEPSENFTNWQQDPFGNYQGRLVFENKTEIFEIKVDLVADMAAINPFDFFVEDYAKTWPFVYAPDLRADLIPYLTPERAGARLQAYLDDIEIEAETSLDFVCELNRRLESDIEYVIRMEPGVQTPEHTLAFGKGSCRDTSWLLVQVLRNLGLAARFCSGYLIQLKPDIKPLEGPVGPDEDFTDLHAWAEVYLPGAGWIGLDPTSGLLAGEGHIPLAATPHPTSAAPISGSHEEAGVKLEFAMAVQRIKDTPRVTKPYSLRQWQNIIAIGKAIDERLKAGDVRLSMGGEPTFVAVDDMEGEEWTTEAVGPTKRRYADALTKRLRERFGHKGLLHYGQGKWYPGEQLPRWAFSLYWRYDGEPIWENQDLIDTGEPSHDFNIEDAAQFSTKLCEHLGLPADSPIAAFEDQAHFVLSEQRLPLEVDPADNQLEDKEARHRMIRAFERGLTTPAAYVLPIQVWNTADLGRRWCTEQWQFRRNHLFLAPGDSPAGLRLPLGALPYIPPASYPHVIERDPLDQHEPLIGRRDLLAQRRVATRQVPSNVPELPDDVEGAVRTALSVEPREGHLCIFMPPVTDAEDYVSLAVAIEETAQELDQPVHIEGYTPPFDPRLNSIKVTPDPGVVEVNIHPALSWEQAIEITTGVYEEARLARLSTEKFDLDGKHIGTGGGNHIVLGGETPSESPFLRRPDLLASLITYWQNHPSLSYLFSGQFIGPTSQAPRVDEGRHEQLYELEIAFNQLPAHGEQPIPLWLVDRLFRNLLTDVTGNTHRSEICIDKLYSPDGPSDRLGLVEFRSFEMPPHPHMSLAQQLLLRALVAWFWEKPYRQRLVRWGTDLHDRFMLPHFVWSDFCSVIADLQDADFDLEAEWFEPHFEFRFPRYGTVVYEGIELELRQALEPWHVLGEEGAPGGTARYVDSSLERLQVKVNGLTDDRHIVLCCGQRVPLAPTGLNGEGVAGVRYRAWQPPECLHPTIGIHTPLVFDVVDTWNGRSIGGCRYHVFHPGGRGHEKFPVNALEAEGRRLERFEPMGHTPGPVDIPDGVPNRDYPHTLDLRLTS